MNYLPFTLWLILYWPFSLCGDFLYCKIKIMEGCDVSKSSIVGILLSAMWFLSVAVLLWTSAAKI